MTVEDKRGGGFAAGRRDCFPVGMRVLAVDDDPTCLKVLENLLRSCKYHVTTTNQAVMALKMLRENKNVFDLVISDVNMPDMDGFKLLELVGLEMELPVIMLSAHSDPKLVMKGITHGAVDYLLKPVRMEELKNIWQHVVRRKKFDSWAQNSTDADKGYSGSMEAEWEAALSVTADPNGKLNRKRKDQNEEEAEDDYGEEENGCENEEEDPSSQKKARVVWSVELHRKFVGAVHQLGLEKAVPKKIQDLMNVEGLTRENVASHLQKYRLYLRRISRVASQQANMVAAAAVAAALGGSRDPSSSSSLMGIGCLDDFGGFHALSSYPPPLGRLNSPAGLGLGFGGITASGIIIQEPSSHPQPFSSCSGSLQQAKSMASNLSTNIILQGTPTPLELKQFQLHIDGSNSSNSMGNNHLFLQQCQQQPKVKGETGARGHSFMDQTRCCDHFSSVYPVGVAVSDPLNHDHMPTVGDFTSHCVGDSHVDFSVLGTLSSSQQCQTGFAGSSSVQNVRHGHEQRWIDTNDNNYKQNRRSQSFDNNMSSPSPIPIPTTNSFDNPGQLSSNMRPCESYLSEQQTKLHDNFILGSRGGYEQFDELMSMMIKQEPNTTSVFMMAGDTGFDRHLLGSSYI